jgi:hypothetical protein
MDGTRDYYVKQKISQTDEDKSHVFSLIYRMKTCK